MNLFVVLVITVELLVLLVLLEFQGLVAVARDVLHKNQGVLAGQLVEDSLVPMIGLVQCMIMLYCLCVLFSPVCFFIIIFYSIITKCFNVDQVFSFLVSHVIINTWPEVFILDVEFAYHVYTFVVYAGFLK